MTNERIATFLDDLVEKTDDAVTTGSQIAKQRLTFRRPSGTLAYAVVLARSSV